MLLNLLLLLLLLLVLFLLLQLLLLLLLLELLFELYMLRRPMVCWLLLLLLHFAEVAADAADAFHVAPAGLQSAVPASALPALFAVFRLSVLTHLAVPQLEVAASEKLVPSLEVAASDKLPLPQDLWSAPQISASCFLLVRHRPRTLLPISSFGVRSAVLPGFGNKSAVLRTVCSHAGSLNSRAKRAEASWNLIIRSLPCLCLFSCFDPHVLWIVWGNRSYFYFHISVIAVMPIFRLRLSCASPC